MAALLRWPGMMARTQHKGTVRKSSPSRPARATTPDGGVYIGGIMIGAFGIWLFTIVTDSAWTHGLLGYGIAVAFLVNLYTWRVCAGKSLAGWQRSLARLPLRCVGYGTRGGKPLEAAHGSPRAKAMLLVSVAASAVAIVGLTLLIGI